MLTAHALILEDTVKYYKEEAACYVSKEKMSKKITLSEGNLRNQRARKEFLVTLA